VLGLLGLVPGMPNLVFLLFTAGCWACLVDARA
jgi:flagellar biosynthesis component FlhA